VVEEALNTGVLKYDELGMESVKKCNTALYVGCRLLPSLVQKRKEFLRDLFLSLDFGYYFQQRKLEIYISYKYQRIFE
jgi:hypothetical protein